MDYSAIVVAGGGSTRFGSDKLAVEVDGVTLLDRVLAACAGATQTYVVGPLRAVHREVTWLREEPPGAGPAAAVRVALDHVRTSQVVLLAADLPYVTPDTVERLLAHADACLVDQNGRAQYLCTAVHTGTLRAAAGDGDWTGRSMRDLLRPVDLTSVAAIGREARDVDRREDVPSDP